jgi:hypothetical protein
MAPWPCEFIKWFTDSRIDWWYCLSIQDFSTKQSANTWGVLFFSACLLFSLLPPPHMPFSGSEHTVSCLAWDTLSTMAVQHHFLSKFPKGHPSSSVIVKWHSPFTRIGCVAHRKPGQGELSVYVEYMWRKVVTFCHTQPLSVTCIVSRELGLPRITI